MKREPTAKDQITIEHLLSQVVGRVGGALDIWTLVCLDRLVPRRHEFLARHTGVVAALVIVLRAELAGLGRADVEPERRLLAELTEATTLLSEAFSTLERHETATVQEIRAATDLLKRAYADTHGSVRELGRVLGVEASYLKEFTPEREQYFQRILGDLNRLFMQTRPAAEALPIGR